MKNRLTDLADHLFAQLERLGDESMNDEAVRSEIARAGAMTAVAREIIGVGKLAVDAARLRHDAVVDGKMPKLLGLNEDDA